jgi:hypothetical protein
MLRHHPDYIADGFYNQHLYFDRQRNNLILGSNKLRFVPIFTWYVNSELIITGLESTASKTCFPRAGARSGTE